MRLSLAVVLVATSTFAAVDPRVLEAVKKVKATDYPSANALTVLSEQAVVFQPDGQFINTSHTARLVLTASGKAEAATKSIPYAKDAEKLEVLAAQVVKADGSVVVADPKRDVQDVEQSGEENIYDPQGRSVKVTFAGLEVGDVVDVTWKLTRELPTRVGFFNDMTNFQGGEPIAEQRYSVDGPASLPLTSEIYHPERGSRIVATKAKVGDRLHYTWVAKNVSQLISEESMNFDAEVPMLVITTDPSWQHFSQWWAQLTEPQLTATPDLKAKVAELTKAAKTDDEKVRALYDFVAQDIRYRGLGVGPRTGYTPRKAGETLASRWGVCRDVAILLTAMLRESGLEAWPVLTNVGDPVLRKVAYDGFNHAIVAMPKKGGGFTFIDPTAKNNTALLPGYEAEQDALVSTLKGEPLGAIPPVDPVANRGRAIATTTFGADRSMTSKVRFETSGMFDMVVRSMAARMPKDELRERFEALIRSSLPDAQLKSFELSNAAALSEPMRLELELVVPNAMPKAGELRLARTVVTSGALGLVENVLPQWLGALPNRRFGLDAHFTFQYDQEETITLPGDVKLAALPNDVKVANKVSEVTSSCTRTGATVECRRSFKLKTRFVDIGQYKALRGSFASLAQVAHQPLILEGGAP